MDWINSAGPRRTLVGLVMKSRRVPRHGYPVVSGAVTDVVGSVVVGGVVVGGVVVGTVTSGGPSPSVGAPIAMAYVAADAGPGPFYIDVRGRAEPASIIELPFYDRRKQR